ncbi:hypothetical protein [Rhizobium sp. G21]|uniref:hypothetical protein n=1 Tax=Rhizobium sp. G21 TaxID=2758439 RepID=UPI001603F71D|nr:hypothetical protein [Rhizobium sp. G21]MBB1247855.1 hypothetical protein [Rhizobium sp. G21]
MLGFLKDWKLKLRYGRLKTAFRHFTVIADGLIVESNSDFGTEKDMAAVFSMKVWATDTEEAIQMAKVIGWDVGFNMAGKCEVYTTAPEQPPGDNPHGYDLKFFPYIGD